MFTRPITNLFGVVNFFGAITLALAQSSNSLTDPSTSITTTPPSTAISTTSTTPTSSSVSTSPTPSSINITAIIGQNNVSSLQCWNIQPDLVISDQKSSIGARIQAIGNITGGAIIYYDSDNVTFTGLHFPPAPEWLAVLAGGGIIKMPTTDDFLLIGLGDIIIVNDTSSVTSIGHEAIWLPGTIAIRLPFADGQVNHTAVNNGSCVVNGSHT